MFTLNDAELSSVVHTNELALFTREVKRTTALEQKRPGSQSVVGSQLAAYGLRAHTPANIVQMVNDGLATGGSIFQAKCVELRIFGSLIYF